MLYAEDIADIKALATPASEVACKILAELDPEDHPETLAFDTKGTGGLEIYDACAMAAWLAPELLTATPCHVDVDDEGRTLCDLEQTGESSGINCYVGTEIDRDGFARVLEAALAGEA